MAIDLYEQEKVRAAEMATEELEIRAGRHESDLRPMRELTDQELEEMSRWDPEHDPNVIQDLGNGITLRKRHQRSTARKRLKGEPDAESPDDALERDREETAEAKDREPATPPRRPAPTPPKRKQARIDLGEGLSWIIGLAGTGLQVSGRDPAVGRALAFESPVAGAKLDVLIAGTVVDKIAQPLARAGKMGADLGAVLALPILVGLIERNPALYPVLEPIMKPMVVEMWIEVQEASSKAAKRLEAAQSKAGGQKIDADALMAMLFQGEAPPEAAEDAQ